MDEERRNWRQLTKEDKDQNNVKWHLYGVLNEENKFDPKLK